VYLRFLTTDQQNIYLGWYSGSAYTINESNNICIDNNVNGILGESNTLKIGNGQTSAYKAGVWNNTTYTGDHQSVFIDNTGKVHVIPPGQSMYIGELLYENPVTDLRPLIVLAQISMPASLLTNTSFSLPCNAQLQYTRMQARYTHVAILLSGFFKCWY
jgi:hypothetical protein